MSLGKRYNADWAAIVLGIGVGLTAALYIETTRSADWSSTYATVISLSRVSALLGSFLAIVGLGLVSRHGLNVQLDTIVLLFGIENSDHGRCTSSHSTFSW